MRAMAPFVAHWRQDASAIEALVQGLLRCFVSVVSQADDAPDESAMDVVDEDASDDEDGATGGAPLAWLEDLAVDFIFHLGRIATRSDPQLAECEQIERAHAARALIIADLPRSYRKVFADLSVRPTPKSSS